jgi:methyl acetate hydrolase
MKQTLIAGCIVIFGACSATPPKPDPAVLTSTLDTLFRTAIEQKKVPGAVAIVVVGDKIAYDAATSMNKDTIFAIASMTKPVTSVAIMQLVEAGKVKLDEPASTYVPDLAKVQVLDNGKLRAPRNPITVRHLLTHTAGFSYEFMSPEILDRVKKGKLPSMLAGGDAFLNAPLLFDPGQRWEYGINTDWLGRVVEKVGGQKLDEYFRVNIFDPLAMPDSYFQVPDEKKNRIAKRYQRKDGTLSEQPVMPLGGATFLSGGGGLLSTAADYMRLMRAILNGGELDGKRILKPETVALMGQNHIGELNIRPFRSLAPEFATDNAALPGALDKFGLGFALNSKAVDHGRGANTMSWAGIFNTFFWIDRERKLCAVLMTQMSPGLDEGPRKLLEDFDRAVYSWLQ